MHAESPTTPFALLRAMEAGLATGGPGPAADAPGWSGLGFFVHGDAYLVALDQVREVAAVPALTRVPGAEPWLLGLSNLRGEVLPIVDLAALLGVGAAAAAAGNRVLVLNHADVPVGVLVESVAGLLEFGPAEQAHDQLGAEPGRQDFVLGAFAREPYFWTVLSLRELITDPPGPVARS